MPEPRIIIFVKAPRPGFVKTRLAAAIGNEAACDAYRQLAETVLANLAPLAHAELRFTPDDAENEITPWLSDGWTARPQGNGDLGKRMHRAFSEANGPAIIIGSDCPEVKISDLQAAAEALQTQDAVLGPAKDGGYWLIGLNAPCPALFDGIEWSTETVLQTTLEKADKAGLTVKLLRELADVDDWESFNDQFSKLEKST
jgi:rSAM/selenodomain-associated transferase 1